MAKPRQTIVSLEDTPYYHSCSGWYVRLFCAELIIQQARILNVVASRIYNQEMNNSVGE